MYDVLGGKAGIDKLVEDFYRIMSTDPELREVFATHSGHDIKISAQKLKAFLSGWTGGPQDYLNTYGHPRLRMRHSPFTITQVESEQWLLCMKKALQNGPMAAQDQERLLEALSNVTTMLINRS